MFDKIEVSNRSSRVEIPVFEFDYGTKLVPKFDKHLRVQ